MRTGRVIELRCTADLDSKTGGANARAEGERDNSLGERGACDRRRGAALRPAFHGIRSRADGRDFKHGTEPALAEVVTAKLEPSLAHATLDDRFQFERLAYVALDPKDSQPGKLVFNRTITLKDAWAKETAKA